MVNAGIKKLYRYHVERSQKREELRFLVMCRSQGLIPRSLQVAKKHIKLMDQKELETAETELQKKAIWEKRCPR